jgi:hypothetical protein
MAGFIATSRGWLSASGSAFAMGFAGLVSSADAGQGYHAAGVEEDRAGALCIAQIGALLRRRHAFQLCQQFAVIRLGRLHGYLPDRRFQQADVIAGMTAV